MNIFEDKVMFNTIKEQNGFENRDQRFLNLVQKELQKEEDKIALENGRQSEKVILKYENNETNINTYNFSKNKIELFCKNETEPIELLTSLIHESTHANEHNSNHYSDKQKELFKALTVFQIEDSKKGYLYTCNITELISKTAELRQLLNSYNNQKNNITDIKQGLMFYQAFKNQSIFIKSINSINISKTKIEYLHHLFLINKKLFKSNGLNKQKVITNYIKNINKEYSKILKEFNILKREYKRTLKSLYNAYDKNYSETDIEVKKRKEESNIQKEKEINKLDNIVDIAEFKEKDTEEKKFDNFNEFKEFIKNHKNQKVCIICGDYEKDKYEIVYEKQEELSIPDKEETKHKEKEQPQKNKDDIGEEH